MEGGIDNQVEPKSKFSKRQRQRQCIVECLYMWEMQRDLPVEELFAAYCEEKRENVEEEVLQADFVLDSLKGVSNYSDVLDEKIRNCAKNWSFSRIAKMDLAILRLAIYELFFVKTPLLSSLSHSSMQSRAAQAAIRPSRITGNALSPTVVPMKTQFDREALNKMAAITASSKNTEWAKTELKSLFFFVIFILLFTL